MANSKNNSVQHNTTDIILLSTTYIEPLSTTEYHLVPLGTTSTAQYHLVSLSTIWFRFRFASICFCCGEKPKRVVRREAAAWDKTKLE